MSEKKLLKVLIIDDEMPIRQRLRLYDWDACGAVVVDEAENGEIALDLCSKWLPDIVLTDIVMPVMNGLDFIRVASQAFPEMKFILLSMHSDFDYVRQALKLGAVDYLVKLSLNQQEIEQTIAKAREELESVHSLREHQQETKRKRYSQLFRQMIGSSESDNSSLMHELFQSQSQSLRTFYPLRFIRLFVQTKHEDQFAVDQEVRGILTEMERTATALNGEVLTWFPIHLGDYFIYTPQENSLEAIVSYTEQFVSSIECLIGQRLSFLSGDAHAFGIVSASIQQHEQFREVFRDTFYWFHEFFYQPESSVFVGEHTPMLMINSTLSARMKSHLLRYFSNAASFVQYLRTDYIQWATEVRANPNELKLFMIKFLQDWGITETGTLEPSISLQELVSNMIYLLEQNNKANTRSEVWMAKEIIDKRLGESIMLTMVAEEVGLSSDYLSKLFHEQLGESFKDYVTRCRIERAAQLLKNSSMKVYEIAESVGFPNYRYFCSLFRKITGLSPTDFKKGSLT
jgi:two-component system response regulator YesN